MATMMHPRWPLAQSARKEPVGTRLEMPWPHGYPPVPPGSISTRCHRLTIQAKRTIPTEIDKAEPIPPAVHLAANRLETPLGIRK